MPQLHLLDLAGPAQVFSTAADLGHHYALSYVASTPSVPSHQGVVLSADTEWPELATDDLIMVPGWLSTSAGRPGAGLLAPIVAHHAAGGTVASICVGAFALGRAGLLDGRRCTTHHEVQDRLAAQFPRASVVRDVLYVEDGRIITSAGVASGIDLALHLIAVRHGPAAAAQLARAMVV